MPCAATAKKACHSPAVIRPLPSESIMSNRRLPWRANWYQVDFSDQSKSVAAITPLLSRSSRSQAAAGPANSARRIVPSWLGSNREDSHSHEYLERLG